MKVYTCTDHVYHWPVGVASVVVADNRHQAKELLIKALKEQGGLEQGTEPFTLQELDISTPNALVLLTGQY